MLIDGVSVTVDPRAVVIAADRPLSVVSAAPVGGGVTEARTLVNIHVDAGFAGHDLDGYVDGFARTGGLAAPWVGFLTAARTERAEVVMERVGDVLALAVVTVGLSHRVAAGLAARVEDTAPAGTINAIVVVDAALETAALVNALATVAEVKAAVLALADVRCSDGALATGTATDVIAIAATGRGVRQRFGGPATVPGAAIARAARQALTRGVERWPP